MIASAVPIKSWLAETPAADAVRPSHCVHCGLASRPFGANLVVHGQGLVERQVRGPLEVGAPSETVVVAARKFECQACWSVMTVVPAGVVPGRHYSGSAIALALFLWLVEGLADRVVRDRIGAWPLARRGRRRGWAQLYRWTRDAARLFVLPRPVSIGADARAVARGVVTLLGHLGCGEDDATRVFAGAAMPMALTS